MHKQILKVIIEEIQNLQQSHTLVCRTNSCNNRELFFCNIFIVESFQMCWLVSLHKEHGFVAVTRVAKVGVFVL